MQEENVTMEGATNSEYVDAHLLQSLADMRGIVIEIGKDIGHQVMMIAAQVEAGAAVQDDTLLHSSRAALRARKLCSMVSR